MSVNVAKYANKGKGATLPIGARGVPVVMKL